ncbi:hypothetical protein OO184_19035 [Photorhabdus sp. APURE]|nr:hypothetical protein [Photorhabdus aballayi]
MNLNDRTDIMTVGTMIEVIYGRVEPYSEILKMASERIKTKWSSWMGR